MNDSHKPAFAEIDVGAGYLLLRLPVGAFAAKGISWLTLAGMLMPLGILSEVLLGVPPLLVLVGGVSMVAAMVWFGVAAIKLRLPAGGAAP